MANTAQDHNNIADTLTTQVVEALKTVERKHENIQKTARPFLNRYVVYRLKTSTGRPILSEIDFRQRS